MRPLICLASLLALSLHTLEAHAACQIGDSFVTASSLNQRSAPRGGAIVGKSQRGQKVRVHECRGEWARVSDDRAVWVHSRYLSKNASIATTMFSQPEKVCRSLASEGLHTRGWGKSNVDPGEYLCTTDLIPFGPVGSVGLASNIALYVYGSSRKTADEIRVKININNPATRREAFTRLERATRTLHREFGLAMPPGLEAAISAARPAEIPSAYGTAALVYEPGNIDSFIVVVTSAQAIAGKQAKIDSARSDYERCRQAVADTTRHAMSDLIGDGDPVEERGYRSFFIKGPNRDQFFCEVHRGGRYKIKAAIRSQYPFRYIDEGNLPD